MRYVARELEPQVLRAAKAFAAVVLTGPPRAGKTELLRHVFPKASYALLEDPNVLARLRSDPQGFFDALKTPVVLDEVQNAPRSGAVATTIAPGVRAMPWESWLSLRAVR